MGNAFSWIKEPVEFIVNTVKDVVNLGITAFKLVKEIIFSGIVGAKAFIDLLLSSFELLASIIDVLEYSAELLSRYLHIPFIYVYLIPFFLASGLLIKFINILVNTNG